MASQEWLSIDHKTCSPSQLVAFIEDLDGGKHDALRSTLKKELVDRLRAKGLTDQRIIEELLRGVGTSAKRNKIAKDWAPVFGLTPKELKRIVLGN